MTATSIVLYVSMGLVLTALIVILTMWVTHAQGQRIASWAGELGMGNADLHCLTTLADREKCKLILEIGFNKGGSSRAFLKSPQTCVVSVDLGEHAYVFGVKEKLDRDYPGRHQLVLGDSTTVIPAQLAHLEGKVDLCLIDGGHYGEVPYIDLVHCMRLVRTGGLVVVDDCESHGKVLHWFASWREAPTLAVQRFMCQFPGTARVEHSLCTKNLCCIRRLV